MECRICRTDGWWDQQGHKILAWTQIVSRQSASLCSFNSEKFILCNLLLPADIVDNVSLVYLLSTCCDIVWQLGPCNVTWPGMCWSQVARSRGWTVLLDQGPWYRLAPRRPPLPPAQTGSRDGSATCKARLCRPTDSHYFPLYCTISTTYTTLHYRSSAYASAWWSLCHTSCWSLPSEQSIFVLYLSFRQFIQHFLGMIWL